MSRDVAIKKVQVVHCCLFLKNSLNLDQISTPHKKMSFCLTNLKLLLSLFEVQKSTEQYWKKLDGNLNSGTIQILTKEREVRSSQENKIGISSRVFVLEADLKLFLTSYY